MAVHLRKRAMSPRSTFMITVSAISSALWPETTNLKSYRNYRSPVNLLHCGLSAELWRTQALKMNYALREDSLGYVIYIMA